MKSLSKIWAIISSFVILISMFAFPASAADVTYTVSGASGTVGSNVTVTVKMSSTTQIWGANVSLKYNAAELQYVSHSQGGIVSGGSLVHKGSSVNFSGMYNAKSGNVFSVTFKILKASGTSTITLSSTENTDSNGVTHTCSATGCTVTIVKPVTSIKLDKTSVTLKKGETAKLVATVEPGDATNKKVTYTSSNKKIAKVSADGTITAVGGGTATITAKAGDKKATCKVNVNVAQTGVGPSGEASKTVALGSTLALKVAKVPADATDNFPTTWTSADVNIATVDAKGVVTGVALGTTTITAVQNNWTVTYTITVTEPVTESTSAESTTITETTTLPTTTEPVTEPIEDENTVTMFYHYAMLIGVAVVVAIVSATVTYFVTSGYYKNKEKRDEFLDE